MKITDIHIDGFGVWHDLTLRGLSPELTVFYGPNEAGKSTLMNFLRTVLYGVTPQRRKRYLPPLAGGRPGGSLKVLGENGPFTITRYADRSADDVGKVTITTADGQEQGDRLLLDTLEHVDEQTYINIFAVGLREVQELNSLSDTAAAQWLYRLTSGLDRVSLYDVIRMLGRSRTRLLELGGRAVGDSRARRQARTAARRARRTGREGPPLGPVGREAPRAGRRSRPPPGHVEGTRGPRAPARNRHQPQAAVDRSATRSTTSSNASSASLPLEEGTLETLDELNQHFEEHQRQRDILKGQRQQLREEAQRLGINDILVRNGQRLEALAEQQEWLISLEKQVGDLADEVKLLEARLASENERLAHEWTGAGKIPPSITTELVEQLSPQAKAIEATEQMLTIAKNELEHPPHAASTSTARRSNRRWPAATSSACR